MEDMELTKENIKNNFDKLEGFIKHNKMKLEELDDDKVVLSVKLNKNSFNPNGTVHGGLIFGLADTAMGTLCYAKGTKGATIDSNISYLKPCKGETIKCIATTVKIGNTIGVYKAEIYNSKNELAAIATANYIFLNK